MAGVQSFGLRSADREGGSWEKSWRTVDAVDTDTAGAGMAVPYASGRPGCQGRRMLPALLVGCHSQEAALTATD